MHSFRALPLVIGMLVLSGCGGGSNVVEVSGMLTRNGKPVPYLTIHFVPENGRSSWGVSDGNGQFSMKQDKKTSGVLVGTHTVWVEWRPLTPIDEMDPKNAKKPTDLASIREKYGTEARSPLKIEIGKSVDNLEIKLD
jgi:hypothetical protein